MNVLEDKVRAALQVSADGITARDLPPLRLRRRSFPGLAGRFYRPGALHRFAPVAAAAGVAAAVAAAAAVTGGLGSRQPRPVRPLTGPATAQRTAAVPSAAMPGVPPYYLALPHGYWSATAQLRSTATGTVLATIAPPTPKSVFTWVNGTPGGTTFVLGAQRWWPITSGTAGASAQRRDNAAPTTFYVVRFDPSARTVQLSPVRLPAIASSRFTGVALSPDGKELALSLFGGPDGRGSSIRVVWLATGAQRRWVWPGAGTVANRKPLGQAMSWADDNRQLAFQFWNWSHPGPSVRLLDTATPGPNLETASRLVTSFPNRAANLAYSGINTLLTPDGGTIVAAVTSVTDRQHARWGGDITAFSTATGRPVWSRAGWQAPHTAADPWQEVLWAGPGGRAMIVIQPYHGSNTIGVLTGNRFTPLPGAPTANIFLAW